MKRLLITALMLFATGSISSLQAQKSRQYDDDIYGGQPSTTEYRSEESSNSGSATNNDNGRTRDDEQTYSSSGRYSDSRDYSRQSQGDEEYYDSDDDYYYSSRINRFNYPFYNRGYWSSYYNPFWYDPFWVDPYWGWSPWTRPGVNISIGMGPYWSSYWGWSSWYGSPYWGSYWGNPWGGWGWGGGFYSGYWNGYYAGLYNGYGYGDGIGRGVRGRTITYGPRYSLRSNASANNAGIGRGNGYNGFRTAPVRGGVTNSETRSIRNEGVRTISGSGSPAAVREDRIRTNETNNNSWSAPREDRAVRNNGWNDAGAVRTADPNASAPAPRRERSSWFNSGTRTEGQAPRTAETPRVQEQRSFPQPRSEQRYQPAPSRSFDRGGGGGSFGGGRSFGGSGGGGGSFGGGGRRR